MDSAKQNYFLIFKSFFMKKLFIALGCFAAILLTSSCTEDSPIETKTENMTTTIKTPVSGTEVSDDGIDDPIAPRPK